MRRIETIRMMAGETPSGTLTMATHPPRRKRVVRVVRERDYLGLLSVAKALENHIRFAEINHEDSWFQVEDAMARAGLSGGGVP